MEQREEAYVREVRGAYAPREESKVEKLRRLDAKVRRPADVFAYLFGAAGALVLGTGMCLAMGVIGNMMPLGVAVGAVGIAMAAANYFLYRAIVRARKRKYAGEVLALTDELLNEKR